MQQPPEEEEPRAPSPLVGALVAVLGLVALVGIPLVLVTHRDFATVQSGTAVPIPSATASIRLALSPVSGNGQAEIQVTGLGFPSDVPIQVTASTPGAQPSGPVGQATTNDRGAFVMHGRLPAAVVSACASGPQACAFEGASGIVLVTASTSDHSQSTEAAYKVTG